VGGLFTGIWLARHISTALFRRIALIVVLASAATAIVSGVAGL